MNPSLSVILPVHNAEGILARVVGKLLEFLPELTARFEIVVVDDGSTDHTAEIADELRRLYPQVRLARHGWQWGMLAATRTGRLHCRGNLVLVLDAQREVSPEGLTRQWESVADQAPCRIPSSSKPDSSQPLHVVRTEPAHGNPSRQREPSFLRHLRQLSGAM